MSSNNFKKKCEDDQIRRQRIKQREQEHIDEKISKSKSYTQDVHNKPVPVDFNTFEGYELKYGTNTKTKTPKCFGTSQRFEVSEEQKWKNKIEKYNHGVQNTEGARKVDQNKDGTPGPNYYNLQPCWYGTRPASGKVQSKKPKKKEDSESGGNERSVNPWEDKRQVGNIFSKVSTGPHQSIYHNYTYN